MTEHELVAQQDHYECSCGQWAGVDLSGHTAHKLIATVYKLTEEQIAWVSKVQSAKSSTSPNPTSGRSPSRFLLSPEGKWKLLYLDQYLPRSQSESDPPGANGLIGYRGWNIDMPHLTAVTGGYVWTPGINVAQCLGAPFCKCAMCMAMRQAVGQQPMAHSTVHPGQSSPAEGCKCGLWMREALDELLIGDIAFQVLGLVQAWGRCIRHTAGLRCEKMRIVALLGMPIDLNIREQVARAFDVPLEALGRRQSAAVDMIAQHYDVPVARGVDELEAMAAEWRTR